MASIIPVGTAATARTENSKTRLMVFDILKTSTFITGAFLDDDIPPVPQHLTDGLAFSFFVPETNDGFVEWLWPSNNAQSINTVCMYGNDLHLSSGRFQFQYTLNNIHWFGFHDPISPTDSKPYYIMVEQIDNIVGVRLGIDGLTRNPKVAVAMCGLDTQLQFGQEDGFAEAVYAEAVNIEFNDSAMGNRIGASQWNDGAIVTLTNSNVEQSWVRDVWIPIIEEIEPSKPLFCLWDPEFKSDNVMFCEVRGTIPAPKNISPLLADVRLPIKAYII